MNILSTVTSTLFPKSSQELPKVSDNISENIPNSSVTISTEDLRNSPEDLPNSPRNLDISKDGRKKFRSERQIESYINELINPEISHTT